MSGTRPRTGIVLLTIWLLFPVREARPTPPGCLEAPAIAGYNITPSGFTVECWIRVRSKPGFDPRIIQCVSLDSGPCESVGGGKWEIWICNLSECLPGSVVASFQGDGHCRDLLSTTRVDDGFYHHVAVTFDQAVFRLYIDGNLERELESPPMKFLVAGGTLTVGQGFDGEIDELRIWRVPLSRSEIPKFMGRTLPSGSDSLAGYWRFDGDGLDRSASGNTLRPKNYVLFRNGKFAGAADIINGAALK